MLGKSRPTLWYFSLSLSLISSLVAEDEIGRGNYNILLLGKRNQSLIKKDRGKTYYNQNVLKQYFCHTQVFGIEDKICDTTRVVQSAMEITSLVNENIRDSC